MKRAFVFLFIFFLMIILMPQGYSKQKGKKKQSVQRQQAPQEIWVIIEAPSLGSNSEPANSDADPASANSWNYQYIQYPTHDNVYRDRYGTTYHNRY